MNDQSKWVLIVDDERLIREMLSRTLEEEGFSCVVSGDLAQARDRLDEGGFSLVVCDYDLPDGCGLDLADEVRAGHFDIPVVVMSGIDRPDLAAGCAAHGTDGFLAKPFTMDQLLTRVAWLV
jgi:DNA-binding response OmpR family regulator